MFNEFYLRMVGRIHGRNSQTWQKASAKKYLRINNILNKEFSEIILKYKDLICDITICENDPIWVYWGQGIDNAPSIVQLCVNSIIKNAGKHPVILLNDNNYNDYVILDGNTIKMYQEGYISIAHFSDILRFNLLAQKGGIWCDSTLFFSSNISNVCNYKFFSIKHNIGKSYLACRGMWSTFFMGGGRGNIMSKFVAECLDEYWKKHDYPIDYLFLDCIMFLAYEEINTVKKAVDLIPINNENVFEAMQSFDRMDDYMCIIRKLNNCNINKLTYKVINGNEQIELMEKVLSHYS